tara:strand:+ start:144 stop:728 length:585 start_codon:yes stop_codon:yes gene_type:complete
MNYNKIYISIISKAQSRNKLDGYIERHHIIPKSCGGSDDDSNMVALTAREHFLAHYCLWKFNVGQAKHKMAYAFSAMSMGRYMNSRLYAECKKDFKLSKAHKIKIGLVHKGKKLSKAHKIKIAFSSKGKKHSDETKIKIGLSQKGRKRTPDHVQKIQATLKKNRILMTPEKKIAKRLAQRVAYWKARDLIESNT